MAGDNPKTVIEFEGQSYVLPFHPENDTFIVLPDNRVLMIHGWIESFPPTPIHLSVHSSEYVGTALSAENIALMYSTVVAELVTPKSK